ncbi:hypothetical protein DPEC_G00239950 [Dallia pectoralis]|uniref:Uncharacterized protein n=1 Tax=Dallia pectoralis TaxID=75939 RepID=A0ACC2FZ89_DALPE|nr:hypothetical protein DPEC_G00239950 [Dallia pectoralis]
MIPRMTTHNHNEADKTVFVANLGSSANEGILFELFLQAGPLKKVTIPRDREGRQRSYGFVYYKYAEAVPYAIALLNGTWLCGRPIRLQYGTGSSYQDEGSGPQDTEDDRRDPSHGTPRISVNIGLPDSAVFHFTGRVDESLPSQEQFLWNSMVCRDLSDQCPLSISPVQPHYYAPPSPLCPPIAPLLPWPMPPYPRWGPSQHPHQGLGQASLLTPTPSFIKPVKQSAHQREGPDEQKAKQEDMESEKPRKHRRSRERSHRGQRHRNRCKK